LEEMVKVVITGGGTGPRQLLGNPLVDVGRAGVGVIALESCEHLLQLTCFALAGGPPHRLPRVSGCRTERTSVGASYQMMWPLSRASGSVSMHASRSMYELRAPGTPRRCGLGSRQTFRASRPCGGSGARSFSRASSLAQFAGEG